VRKNRTASFLRDLRRTFHKLAVLPIPSIAAISSVALGGGLELALATTFRVCATDAVLGLPETRLGIIPGAGGGYRLRRLVGEGRAMEMVLTGRRVWGWEAGRWGVVERVVGCGGKAGNGGIGGQGEGERGGDGVIGEGQEERRRRMREEVLEAAVQMAREICEGGPVSVGAGMRAVRGGGRVGGEGAKKGGIGGGETDEVVEEREYRACLERGRGDRDEALRAFGEKRAVRFRGEGGWDG